MERMGAMPVPAARNSVVASDCCRTNPPCGREIHICEPTFKAQRWSAGEPFRPGLTHTSRELPRPGGEAIEYISGTSFPLNWCSMRINCPARNSRLEMPSTCRVSRRASGEISSDFTSVAERRDKECLSVADAAELMCFSVSVFLGCNQKPCYGRMPPFNKFENSPNIAEIHGTIAVPLMNMVSHRLLKRLSGRRLGRHNLQSLLARRLLFIRNLPLAHDPLTPERVCERLAK